MGNRSDQHNSSLVYIAISRQRLAELLERRRLAVSDFHCLDEHSKSQVWHTCLEASLRGR